MPHLLSRALSRARTHALLTQRSSSPRIILSPICQTAPVSYKADPLAPSSKNPPPKIPPSARPLHREPTPPPTLTGEALQSMPYIVRRTAFAQLPVYRKWMAGGTKQVVTIKKISGDTRALGRELTEKFDIPEDNLRLNPVTGHLELKGDYYDKTRQYLLERGF
ncbi:39S ribosomal protein-like protein [Hapsidospora chrysogenum ATCC 11550]|uniref:Large ribosomal subunit protein mL49 n=1 Tax=Hapsidospora chrysogenum (strain ATCC 11550 / CBS 779.69 / DSM 880 / IAM 14645 / JCM 23072 / IMI 49137) TaxID=857340 RepID=A0A086TFT4_HAPC1|nr:39S ribosomal protein-like protein [Hapsidospora chrysogenum ATCC 11550]